MLRGVGLCLILSDLINNRGLAQRDYEAWCRNLPPNALLEVYFCYYQYGLYWDDFGPQTNGFSRSISLRAVWIVVQVGARELMISAGKTTAKILMVLRVGPGRVIKKRINYGSKIQTLTQSQDANIDISLTLRLKLLARRGRAIG